MDDESLHEHQEVHKHYNILNVNGTLFFGLHSGRVCYKTLVAELKHTTFPLHVGLPKTVLFTHKNVDLKKNAVQTGML